MDPTVCFNNTTDFVFSECESRVFERLLHGIKAKFTEITSPGGRRTVRVLPRKLAKHLALIWSIVDQLLVPLENFNRAFFCAGDFFLQMIPAVMVNRRQVMSARTPFRSAGRLLSLCFTRMWLALILSCHRDSPVLVL